MWSWGSNNSNAIGDGDSDVNSNRSSPVSVVGGFNDWTFLSRGAFHALAIRENGSIWGWGRNTYGQLADNTITNRSSPESVVGGFTDWVQVSAGGSSNLALRSNGTAWGWGGNGAGMIGDGTTTSRRSPVSVVGGFTDWVQVSAGGHSLGVRANGTAWAWGQNSYGRLGDGTTTSRSSPVSVLGGFTDWIQVSNDEHSAGIRSII
jgi:alpha-tubulin suppressor-like RCC1 family protein